MGNETNGIYTDEDLRQAFEDGNSYGNDELELDTNGETTAFNAWYKIFSKNRLKIINIWKEE